MKVEESNLTICSRYLFYTTTIFLTLCFIINKNPIKPVQFDETFEINADHSLSSTMLPYIPNNQNSFLTFSIRKSGTTVLSWIIEYAFKHLVDLNENYTFENVDDFQTLETKNKSLFFSTFKKHEGRVYSGYDNQKLNMQGSDFVLSVKELVEESLKKNYSLRKDSETRKDSINLMKSSIPKLKGVEKTKQTEIFNKKHFTIFRDPIAVLVSYEHYVFPNISPIELNNFVYSKCKHKIIETSITYELVNKILPEIGYEFELLYFRDLRKDPHMFIKKFLKNIGLELGIEENFIVNKVVEDTSMGNMKKVQEEIVEGTMTSNLKGLSKKGTNSRKVRNAEIKGYIKELKPDTVDMCYKQMRKYLQQELLEKFEIPLSKKYLHLQHLCYLIKLNRI
eukprot:maker-scaffold_28-snap-gene-2.42-mRNA-1 protein AED:0.09 eAED:0.94 QI:0/0/0.5/1/0/0/2/20/393